jgi:hypothetical protein
MTPLRRRRRRPDSLPRPSERSGVRTWRRSPSMPSVGGGRLDRRPPPASPKRYRISVRLLADSPPDFVSPCSKSNAGRDVIDGPANVLGLAFQPKKGASDTSRARETQKQEALIAHHPPDSGAHPAASNSGAWTGSWATPRAAGAGAQSRRLERDRTPSWIAGACWRRRHR